MGVRQLCDAARVNFIKGALLSVGLILISQTVLAGVFGTHESVELPYLPQRDSLCFENGDPELARVGIPILGKLGVKEGVCQGIAGVTASFLENARFDPSQKLPSESQSATIIQTLMQFHRTGERTKVTVPGASNLREFCEHFKPAFLRASIQYNAEIAVTKISPELPLFLTLKKNPLRGRADQERLRDQLTLLNQTLRRGRYPLMLYYRHVVMVTRLEERIPGKQWIVHAYDSNHPNEIAYYSFNFDSNGLPSLNQFMIWVL